MLDMDKYLSFVILQKLSILFGEGITCHVICEEYISVLKTITKSSCLILRDKERLEVMLASTCSEHSVLIYTSANQICKLAQHHTHYSSSVIKLGKSSLFKWAEEMFIKYSSLIPC